MKLKSLTLSPFAGIKNSEIRFHDGLNILLGPNETGKSTAFAALFALLFQPAKMNKKEFDGFRPFLPIGSDHASARLKFESRGENFELSKTWSKDQAFEKLKSSSDLLISSDEIQKRLSEIFVREAEFCGILAASQNSLKETLRALMKDSHSMNRFSDLLRASAGNTGGVSIDAFQAALSEKIESIYKLWDMENDGPKLTKGGFYKKGYGSLYEAYLKMSELKSRFESVSKAEDFHAEKSRAFGKIEEQIKEIRSFLSENESIRDFARDSLNKEERLKNESERLERIAEDNKTWILLEDKIKDLKKIVSSFRESSSSAEKEKNLAEEEATLYKKNKRLIDLKKDLIGKKESVRMIEVRLKEFPKDFSSLLEELKSCEEKIKTLRIQMDLGELSFQISAKKDSRLRYRFGTEDTAEIQLSPPMSSVFSGKGLLTLESDDFSIQIQAGSSAPQSAETLPLLENKKESLLEKLGYKDFDSANKAFSEFKKLKSQLAYAEEEFQKALGDEDFNAIQNADIQISEDPEEKLREKTRAFFEIQTQLNTKQTELSEKESIFSNLQKKYEDYSAILSSHSRLETEVGALKETLSKKPEIPENFESVPAFLKHFETLAESLKSLTAKRESIYDELLQAKNNLSEDSAEDIAKNVIEAEQQFQKIHSRGAALFRLQEKSKDIISGMDESPFEEMNRIFEDRFSKLTGGRYTSVEFDSNLPMKARLKSGVQIEFDRLSAGAKDSFSIALRLTLSEYFLGNLSGFMIFDDPLTDLDPDRATLCAEVIREFSEKYQTVILTCHPLNAEILGGTRIKLEEIR